jgi:hypothetical protein
MRGLLRATTDIRIAKEHRKKRMEIANKGEFLIDEV